MKLKIKSLSGNFPKYATEGASGMDICAYLEEDVILRPMQRFLVPTGLFLEIPRGYEVQVRARSGLAIKKGIGLVNGIGTIDCDYRGEVKVALINLGEEDFVISNGDRIAQMILSKYEAAEIIEIDRDEDLSETERGAGGFGHTGVKND